MRFKALALALSFSALALLPKSSFADSVTLTLTGTGGASSDGVYIYPYYFTVTSSEGTVNNVAMSCLNFDREITVGETWAVDVVNVPLGTGTLDGESFLDYRADAWLFNQYNNSLYTQTEVQFAIWSIMDPSGVAGKSGFDATAQSLAALALTEANSLPASYFSNIMLFIPDATSPNPNSWTNGEPQIFIVDPPPSNTPFSAPTPEPSSLLLFGTGLTPAAYFIRRRLARMATAGR